MELPILHPHSSRSRTDRDQPGDLRLVLAPQGQRRIALETFIRQRFNAHYQARVRHFMPCLLGLETADGGLHGAVGYRSAEDHSLFLERYLDVPIEQAIYQQSGKTVARSAIVEVGNLAAEGVGMARTLIVALAELLVVQGFAWVAFTGTSTLRNSFRRLGLVPQTLGLADPRRLGQEAADWGSYYDSRPQVMIGAILGGHQRLIQQGAYPRRDYQARFTAPVTPYVACH